MKIEFTLNREDSERLFAVKRRQGKADMPPNDFTCELVQKTIRRICPRAPREEE